MATAKKKPGYYERKASRHKAANKEEVAYNKKVRETFKKPTKPEENVTYVTLGIGAHGLEFKRKDLTERELTPYRNCGLYTSVEWFEFDGVLRMAKQLTPKGVKYFSTDAKDMFDNDFYIPRNNK